MVTFTFYVDEGDLERVRALSKDTYLTSSEIIRHAIREHLNKVESNDGIYIRVPKG